MDRNGIDTTQLDGFVALLDSAPEAGTVRVTTRHRWDTAFAVDGSCDELSQGGQPAPRAHHSFRTDWPEPLSGDTGPTPGAEGLAAMVGACVATTYAAQATRLGATIDELEVVVEGAVDLRRLFELAPDAPGIRGFDVTVSVRSDADDALLETIRETVERTSPAYGAMAAPVPVSLGMRRSEPAR